MSCKWSCLCSSLSLRSCWPETISIPIHGLGRALASPPARRPPWIHREGVRWHEPSHTDLLFVPLLGPGPSLFPRESQSTIHQIGAEGRKTLALGRGQGLPALQPHRTAIRAQHGAIGQQETRGAVEHAPARLAAGPQTQLHSQLVVAPSGFAAQRSANWAGVSRSAALSWRGRMSMALRQGSGGRRPQPSPSNCFTSATSSFFVKLSRGGGGGVTPWCSRTLAREAFCSFE